MKQNINFFLSTEIYIGEKVLAKIANHIVDMNANKIGIISDSNLINNDYFLENLGKIRKKFPENIVIYNDFGGEPTYGYLEEINSSFKEFEPDVIIAFGGGSTMDLGKGISILLTNDSPALNLKGFPRNINSPIPLITVPSIFGSGSEVSYNAVFIDEKEKRKLGINSRKAFPKKTFMDPLLTMSAPPQAVLASALDSLVHCVDSFGSVKHSTFSRLFSVEGFRYTFNALLNKDLEVPENRIDLAIGSIFGIVALMNSGDGPTNGFAYYFGVKDKIPHGLAGGIFLKEVMKWNFLNGYSEYYKLLGHKSGLKIKDFNSHFFDNLEKLYEKMEIPTLRDFGYNRKEIALHAKKTSTSLAGSFEGNPINFDIKSAEEVLLNLI